MTSPQTLTLGEHVAHLDPIVGVGMFDCPSPYLDVLNPDDTPGPRPASAFSIHALSWDAALAALARLGWGLVCDASGWPLDAIGTGGRGGQVFLLELLADDTPPPSVGRWLDACHALRDAVGLVEYRREV